MIDNPVQVTQLVAKLRAALPLSAMASPPLLATVREGSPGLDLPSRCRITRVDYAGDEGGIMCQLDFGLGDGREVVFASITHLIFDPRQPLGREIAAYQKHRTKRLRRGRSGLPLQRRS